MKLILDLHDIYNRGGDIDRALRAVIDEAIDKRVRLVEIKVLPLRQTPLVRA